ncbi:MAG: hypothetical protein ACUVXB_17885, partial [Bryobacteraceae bacterium]
MNLVASLPANPAAQEPLSQPVDMHQHALIGLFHLGYGMGFQTQLFSDKRLYEHLGSGPFVFLGRKHEINPMPGCRSNPRQAATPRPRRASTAITLFGEEPLKEIKRIKVSASKLIAALSADVGLKVCEL